MPKKRANPAKPVEQPNHVSESTLHQAESSVVARDEDDIFIDESLVHLLGILLPRMKLIVQISGAVALIVAFYLFLSPRQYVCKAVIAPDVIKDPTSIDLVQLSRGDAEPIELPFTSQLSQLKTLADSSQVKRAIIQENGLNQVWNCSDDQNCIDKLKDHYTVREIRQVGLELEAKTEDPKLSETIIHSATKHTNLYFENIIKERARKSINDIKRWIHDVTQSIQEISNEFIQFASSHNITDIESQFAAGNNLLGVIKQQIVIKEAQLAEESEKYDADSKHLLPIKNSLTDLRKKLEELLKGGGENNIYPPLSDYESLRQKVLDYQDQLNLLRNRAELFNKSLAAAQIESQRQARSVMVLDEPYVTPASKGIVKFFILTFVGVFFLACIFFILKEYWNTIRQQL